MKRTTSLLITLLTTLLLCLLCLSAFADSTVFYGEDAGRTPYMARLEIYGQGWSGNCGGVLIHPEWALTAAHCINPLALREPQKIVVHVGEYNRWLLDGERPIVATAVYTFGYRWEAPDWNTDLALLHLAETLTRTTTMTETIIDFIALSHEQPITGTQLLFYGWGEQDGARYNPILQKGLMTIEATYGFSHETTYGFIHAVGEEYSGHGDSGGPAIISGTTAMAGILVNGRDNFTGFVNVADFAEEIEAVIAVKTRPQRRERVYLPVVYRGE